MTCFITVMDYVTNIRVMSPIQCYVQFDTLILIRNTSEIKKPLQSIIQIRDTLNEWI